MSSTPSWMEASSSPTASSSNTPYQPSWSSKDVKGSTTAAAATTTTTTSTTTGDLQMTSLQVDGLSEPATTAPTKEGDAGAMSNTQAARQKTWGEFWQASFSRDGRMLLITLVVIVVMNIPIIKWALYPFTLFSTWIHEICHGLAAAMVGGKILKLEIFPDTSGLCTFTLPAGNKRHAFVASAGYQGTAVIGMLLLQLRRTKRGPRAGTMAIALMMVLSVCLWIRNGFGIFFILFLGVVLGLGAWILTSWWIRNLYVVLGVTCALNAITSLRALFGNNQEVNGDEVSSDAHVMAEIQGGSHTMWALIWLCLALVLALVGFVFAIPGPDEVADFTLCGMCQDLGCFYSCNAQGRRLFPTLFGREDTPSSDNAAGNNVV
jgi:hypothetical protein